MAQIYVGTYGKYNNGSLYGAWVDVEKFESKEEFYEFCRELHKDEEDPEFMFQDYEDIPEHYIGESWVSEDLWDEWFQIDENEREIVEEYWNEVDKSVEPQRILEKLVFTGNVEEFIDECLEMEECNIPSWVHIDYNRSWNYGLTYDYSVTEHYIFSNY